MLHRHEVQENRDLHKQQRTRELQQEEMQQATFHPAINENNIVHGNAFQRLANVCMYIVYVDIRDMMYDVSNMLGEYKNNNKNWNVLVVHLHQL